MVKIQVQGLYKIFGPHPQQALEMLEQGKDKDEKDTGDPLH